ncbi:putative membrane protein YdjX (TVP38/TMEM64 family) [Natronospira proteinivora]|uniref:TVP38/TMEM64 family membrane protein n=1 Tax=Natronospira proteinivora TaxID=1807133 RepID=A0ABT1G7J6_9GAMM|nr:VTT domain-containing protein [Natronospira proteinivora]MCP1726293.1 putative membrane protein YdjX (TVP38/TMEM64 family) [Natronospira proteinivora]
MKQTPSWRLLLLALVLIAGTLLSIWQPIPLETLLAWGERWMSHPAAWVALITLQALLFTFALPGSTLVWVVAPFLPPLIAVPILVAGSTLGAVGARHFSGSLSRGWAPGPKARAIVDLLERQGNLFTQVALRALPGFPHSVVNYAGGLIPLPLPTFVLAALLGLTAKWWVYAGALHGLTQAVVEEEALDVTVLLPLFLLVGMMGLAQLILVRLRRNSGD